MRIVELKEMCKAYGETVLFRDFSLEISQGEFVAITGKSGSGKSTLLNIIGLLDVMDSGDLILFNKRNPDIESKEGRDILRNKISYLFQNYGLIDEESVYANLRISTRFQKFGHRQEKEKIAEALEAVGLSGYENKKIYQLSGGEQQRIAIAKIMLKPSELILADEPTGSLDPKNRSIIMDLLSKLYTSGKTIIVVTHDPEVAKCASRNIQL